MMKQRNLAGSGRCAGRTLGAAMACWSVCVLALVLDTSAASLASSVNPGNPIHGKELFEKRCGGCHSLDNDKEGPHLRGVYGRKAGSVTGFQYSDALKATHFNWDAASLDRWLTNTESVAPDNDMDFHVSKADERADIIEYLRVTSQP